MRKVLLGLSLSLLAYSAWTEGAAPLHIKSNFSQRSSREGVATYGSACPYTSFVFAKDVLTDPNFLNSLNPNRLEDVVIRGRNLASDSHEAVVAARPMSEHDREALECSVDEIPNTDPLVGGGWDNTRGFEDRNLNGLKYLKNEKGDFCSLITVSGHTSAICHKNNQWIFFDSDSKNALRNDGSMVLISDTFEELFDFLTRFYRNSLDGTMWQVVTFQAPQASSSSLPAREDIKNLRQTFDAHLKAKQPAELLEVGSQLENNTNTMATGYTLEKIIEMYRDAVARQDTGTMLNAGEILVQHGKMTEENISRDMNEGEVIDGNNLAYQPGEMQLDSTDMVARRKKITARREEIQRNIPSASDTKMMELFEEDQALEMEMNRLLGL
ncbi:MAG TPA: hypothetical protein QGF02_00495 [Candidatus Babeliales bacterium]|nr:hypothetical protein [Candidatus Babeliales bacterium]